MQHISDSPNHHVCIHCQTLVDFVTEQQLDNHLEQVHNWCSSCDLVFEYWDDLEEHDVDEHNKCLECGNYFSSPSNLKNHKLTHAEKNVECFACYRKFVSKSAMMLHLEVGNCPSGVDRSDIDDYARQCRQWPQYIDHDDDYKCPTCGKWFHHMSGLLQHVESDCCDEDLESWWSPLAVFLRFLRSHWC
ncbi:hypothetical protein TrVGV298_012153 [Trichoderma virens]|nr:hypothetical protein TrVGV298_012153 [Trichoderma virens]